MRKSVAWWGLSLVLLSAGALRGQEAGGENEAVLPPVAAWDGASRQWQAAPGDPWVTPAEESGLRETPDYEATLDWLRQLAKASPHVSLSVIGRSHRGLDIPMVLISRDGSRASGVEPEERLPLVLVHAGIHGGEIDGKDAGLMLLRDLTVTGKQASLLEQVDLLFIPILNVDGHERTSRWGRINQRGPRMMGWRTNSRNQNLNRDFAKLDTPEVRSLITVINHWQPDLYVDLHVTDGMDYQYDITWGYNGPHAHSPAVAAWLDARLTPAAESALSGQGHIPGPLFFSVDGRDISRGLLEWTADPRFSNGYGDVRHLPTVLVENHSLKPYRQRVLGTYVLLTSILETVGRHGAGLRQAVAADRARAVDVVPLSWSVPASAKADSFALKGIEQMLRPSDIAGHDVVTWTGKPVVQSVPWLTMDQVSQQVRAPRAYLIPPEWSDVIGRLADHGIQMERLAETRDVRVEMYRLADIRSDETPFEGHIRVSAAVRSEIRKEKFPPGTVRVSVDQPLGRLAVLLLEPLSPDSFFQWGFFLDVLQRTEYAEPYVMEPTAQRMLEAQPGLAVEFQKALEDKEFEKDPRARLQWFYERSPWFDSRFNLYPVGREVTP